MQGPNATGFASQWNIGYSVIRALGNKFIKWVKSKWGMTRKLREGIWGLATPPFGEPTNLIKTGKSGMRVYANVSPFST